MAHNDESCCHIGRLYYEKGHSSRRVIKNSLNCFTKLTENELHISIENKGHSGHTFLRSV